MMSLIDFGHGDRRIPCLGGNLEGDLHILTTLAVEVKNPQGLISGAKGPSM